MIDESSVFYFLIKSKFLALIAVVLLIIGFAYQSGDVVFCSGLFWFAIAWGMIAENEQKKRDGKPPLLGMAFYKVAVIPFVMMVCMFGIGLLSIINGKV